MARNTRVVLTHADIFAVSDEIKNHIVEGKNGKKFITLSDQELLDLLRKTTKKHLAVGSVRSLRKTLNLHSPFLQFGRPDPDYPHPEAADNGVGGVSSAAIEALLEENNRLMRELLNHAKNW